MKSTLAARAPKVRRYTSPIDQGETCTPCASISSAPAYAADQMPCDRLYGPSHVFLANGTRNRNTRQI